MRPILVFLNITLNIHVVGVMARMFPVVFKNKRNIYELVPKSRVRKNFVRRWCLQDETKKDYTSYKNMPILCNQTPHISTFICLNSFCLGENLDVDWTNSLMTCVKKMLITIKSIHLTEWS